MAGALSGHLLASYNTNQSMNLVTSGLVSFNPYMHGPQLTNPPFTPSAFGTQNSPLSEELSEATAKKIATLQAKLNQKLGPEYISQRPGPGGAQKLTYAEGWKIINLANEVFGFNGWSSSIVNVTTDFIDYMEESKRYSIGVTAVVRVTLRDGVYHEDIGYGMLENSKSKGMALDKCRKEAITDGLKRALRNFGNLLGNCLYDKAYTQEVVKIKVPPPKFDARELHRRPEFETKPNIVPSSTSNIQASTSGSNTARNGTNFPIPHNSKAPSALPPQIKREANETSNGSKANSPHTPVQQPQKTSTTSASINDQSLRDLRANQPPPQRKVTFSNVTGPDVTRSTGRHIENAAVSSRAPSIDSARLPGPDSFEEESFGCSEDDAFFATVDLGDADLGRPIESDADMGRPIDYSEDLSNISVARSDSASFMNNTAQHMNHVNEAPPVRKDATSGILSRFLPHNKRPPATNHAPTSDVGSWQDEDVQASGSNKAHSVGGFHFPPGMNPLQQQNQGRPLGQSFQGANTMAGVKRPAEAVPTRYQSGMRRGMNLQQTSKVGGSSREILAQLEIGEGGDLKRVRR